MEAETWRQRSDSGNRPVMLMEHQGGQCGWSRLWAYSPCTRDHWMFEMEEQCDMTHASEDHRE